MTPKYALRGVSVEKFDTPFKPQTDNISMNLNIPIKTNYSDHAFAIGATIQFLEDDKPFITLEVFCHYEIEPACWAEISENNTKDVVLPKDFVRNLVAIAISTARGALYAKTEGTPLSKFLVPIVELMPDDGEDVVISVD